MATSQGSKKRFFCGHCNDYLCKTVYFQHKRLHFNKDTNEWLKEARIFQSNTSQTPFCPSSSINAPQPLASTVAASESSPYQYTGSSATPPTDSDKDAYESRSCGDNEV